MDYIIDCIDLSTKSGKANGGYGSSGKGGKSGYGGKGSKGAGTAGSGKSGKPSIGYGGYGDDNYNHDDNYSPKAQYRVFDGPFRNGAVEAAAPEDILDGQIDAEIQATLVQAELDEESMRGTNKTLAPTPFPKRPTPPGTTPFPTENTPAPSPGFGTKPPTPYSAKPPTTGCSKSGKGGKGSKTGSMDYVIDCIDLSTKSGKTDGYGSGGSSKGGKSSGGYGDSNDDTYAGVDDYVSGGKGGKSDGSSKSGKSSTGSYDGSGYGYGSKVSSGGSSDEYGYGRRHGLRRMQ